MSEPIKLTDQERAAAALAAHEAVATGYKHYRVVSTVLDAINRLREPPLPESPIVRIREAEATLRALQDGSLTDQKSYTPNDLVMIANMMSGKGER